MRRKRLNDRDSLDRLRPILDMAEDLVELGRKEVESRHDSAVRAEVVPAKGKPLRSARTAHKV